MQSKKIIEQIKQKLSSGFAKDVIYTIIGQLGTMLVILVINKVLSNRFFVDEFGLFNLVKKNVQVISFVFLAGAGISVAKFLPYYLSKNQYYKSLKILRAIVFYVFVITIVLILVLLCFYKQFYQIIISKDDFVIYILTIVYATSLTICTFVFSYYRAKNDFKLYNITQFLIQFLMLLPLILVKEFSIKYVLYSWILLPTIFIFFFIFKELKDYRWIFFRRFSLKNIKSEIKTISIYSLPRLLGDFFLFSFWSFPLVYISNHLSLEDVSYYSVGITLFSMVSPAFSFLGMILLPYVSQALAQNNLKDVSNKINKLTLLYILGSLLAIVCFYFLADFLILLFFSSEYLPSLQISRIIFLSILPNSMYLLFRNPLDAISTIPYNTIILAISFVILIICFNFANSLLGFAYSFLWANSFQGIASFVVWQVLKKSKMHSK